MSDVFAAERVIWVDGSTEELCFPLIYTFEHRSLPAGLVFAPLVATGDFFSKTNRHDLVFDIYNRLSGAVSPLVEAVSFSFDREELTDDQMRDLERRASNRLSFLPRRHLECFLLDPAAIAAFICKHVPELKGQISATVVLDRLKNLGGDAKFKASKDWNGNIDNEVLLAQVDAAPLIKHLCTELSMSKIEFAKTRHSLELLQHIMETTARA
jgi:hypothetical protein